jgi:hypothetical protein
MTVSASSNGSTPLSYLTIWTVKHPCEGAPLTLASAITAAHFIDVPSTVAASAWITSNYIHPAINSSVSPVCTVAYILEKASVGLGISSTPINYTSGTRTIGMKA